MTKKASYYFVLILTVGIGLLLAYKTYYINYWPTDSFHLYIPAARHIDLFSISDIHSHNRFYSLHGKEFLAVIIKFVQHLLGDTVSLFPNVLILIVCFCTSSVMLYLFFENEMNHKMGLLASIIFLGCCWPYLYILQGSHQILVLAVFLIGQTILLKNPKKPFAYLAYGIFVGLSLFSSPTSPVYILGYGLPFIIYIACKNHWSRYNICLFLLLSFAGFCLMVFYFIFPNPAESIRDYSRFIQASRSENNFTKPQIDFGYELQINSERGGGLSWIFKYMFLIMPLASLFYLFCIVFLISQKKIKSIGVIVISLSTPILVELSQVAQFGRNYFSWLLGIIFLIVYAIHQLYQSKLISRGLAGTLVTVFLVVHVYSNLVIFWKDVYRPRMATNELYLFLKNQQKPMYAYKDHPYNVNVVGLLKNPKQKERIPLEGIKRLKDAKDGLVLVLPMTGKSIWVNCQIPDLWSIDPELKELYDSDKFEDFVVATVPTLSSSRIWTQEEEYCSYRDLHLGQITELDRFYGHAFILDATKLQNAWFK